VSVRDLRSPATDTGAVCPAKETVGAPDSAEAHFVPPRDSEDFTPQPRERRRAVPLPGAGRFLVGGFGCGG